MITGVTGVNLNDAVKLADPENRTEPKITSLSYVQPDLS